MSCEKNISKYALAAAAAGVPGAFVVGIDIAAMSGIWTSMTLHIADENNRTMDKHTVAKFIATIAQGLAVYIAGSKIGIMLLHLIPGLGTLSVVAINACLNFIYTNRLGKVIEKEFAKKEFDPSSFSDLAIAVVGMICTWPTIDEFVDAFKNIT
jgi:uncharacterized protein (DUF697 family)